MPTLDFYFGEDEQQRKRRRAKWLIPLVAGLGAAMALGREKPPAPPAPPPPKHIVVPAPAPVVAPPPPIVIEPPPARLAVAPPRLDFGESPLAQIAIIHNEGGQPLARVKASIDGPFLATNGCANDLGPGDDCMIAIVFAPARPGRFSGSLKIRAGEEHAQIALRGSVPRPREPSPIPETPVQQPARTLCFDPPLVHFRTTGEQTITLTNPSAAPVRIVAILPIGGKGQTVSGYEVESRKCLRELKAGQQCRFTVHANELALQRAETMTLTVYYDDPLTGTRRPASVRSACH